MEPDHGRTNQGRVAGAYRGTRKASRIKAQRDPGISRGRERRRQRIWTRALPRHTLLRAVGAPARRYRPASHFPRGEQEQAEVEDERMGPALSQRFRPEAV